MVSRFRTFQVYFGGVFTHVSVDLEEGDITKSRASDFEYVCTILSQDPANRWASDDAAQFKNFNSFEDPGSICCGWW
jgi:hypothetical protein